MTKKAKRYVPVGDFRLLEDERKAVMEVLEKGRISEWKKVAEFEKVFAKYIGSRYCLAVNSGTSALILGLLALKYDERFPKFRDGAKVITSPVSYIATSNAIVLSNLEPVYVDIDKRTFAMKPEEIRKVLKNARKDEFAGILPVHLMGYPNDMDEINRIAQDYGLAVFEDSAQAHGSEYNGRRTGSLGLMGAFSFFIALQR